jgi:hypothetical protein
MRPRHLAVRLADRDRLGDLYLGFHHEARHVAPGVRKSSLKIGLTKRGFLRVCGTVFGCTES